MSSPGARGTLAFMQHHDPHGVNHCPSLSVPPRPRGIDYRRLRGVVSIRDVLRLIDWRPIKVHGSQVRGPCPVHKSSRATSVSFAANLDRNVWYCHASACGEGGNQLDLWVKLTGLPLHEAAIDLCKKLGRDAPWLG